MPDAISEGIDTLHYLRRRGREPAKAIGKRSGTAGCSGEAGGECLQTAGQLLGGACRAGYGLRRSVKRGRRLANPVMRVLRRGANTARASVLERGGRGAEGVKAFLRDGYARKLLLRLGNGLLCRGECGFLLFRPR